MKVLLGLMGLFWFALWAAGCGKESHPGNPDAYQQGNASGEGLCSQLFIDDYNAIASGVRSLKTRDDLTGLRKKAIDFKQKYGAVKCVAEMNGQRTTIDVNVKMDDLVRVFDTVLKEAEAAGGTAEGYLPGSKSCSDRFIRDLSEAAGQERQTREELRATRDRLLKFRAIYSGVVCTFPGRNGATKTYDANRLCDELIAEIDAELKKGE